MRSSDQREQPKKALGNKMFIIELKRKYDSSEFYSKPDYLGSWRHMIYYKYLNHNDLYKNPNP